MVMSININFQYNFRWIINVEGASGTLYEGENFQLQFKFGSRYPFDSPQVNILHFGYENSTEMEPEQEINIVLYPLSL